MPTGAGPAGRYLDPSVPERRGADPGGVAHGGRNRQGGPLAPLLSNLRLDELDQELEKRRRRFARDADEANLDVRSRQAGERVMASVTRVRSARFG